MRGEKERNAGDAVVEIGTEAYELEDLGVAQPVETDPGGARPAADGMAGNLFGDPVGFRDEDFLRRRAGRIGASMSSARHRLPAPAFATELVFSLMTSTCQAISCSSKPGNARARAIKARGRRGRHREAGRIADLVAVARRHEMRHVQREQRGPFGALQRPERIGIARPNPPACAMKSACADQITPSSMLRWFLSRCSSM